MNLKQYQKETLRTFAYRKEPLSAEITDMLHCAIGISTEVGELVEAINKKDIINIGEEIADQMWYISNMANFINYDLTELVLINGSDFNSEENYLNESVILQAELLDIFKKSIFYGKELDINKIKYIITRMTINLNCLSFHISLSILELLDKNIAKLKIRFPEKFTEDLAQNRNLEAERKELEK